MNPLLLDRRSFDAAELMRAHPPRFTHRNKRAVFSELLRPGEVPAGTVMMTRWSDAPLPDRRPARRPRVTERVGLFEYGEAVAPGTMRWHVNFATSDCFAYYAGPLLAQDELQVLEHPALGSLREAATAEGFSLLCVEGGRPTPVLVSGVERRGQLDTAPAPGRPAGLYGNAFARAPEGAFLSALARIEPPTTTNLVAIEAPAYGSGDYRGEEIDLVLATAYAGFRAAVMETGRAALRTGAPARTIVHTGFWGAGAYGGDRELMALLQLVAAELAEVDEVVFHSVHEEGSATFAEARRKYEGLPGATTDEVVRSVLALGYRWGVSNGT